MSINFSMKKCVVVLCLLAIAGGAVYWFVSTKEERADKAGIEILIKFAQRQALEIAIIEQASKLTNYKQQLAVMQKQTPVIPLPVVADTKDINDNQNTTIQGASYWYKLEDSVYHCRFNYSRW